MLDADYLRSILAYDPTAGDFRWKAYRGRLARIGDQAGFTRPDGYVQIKVLGRAYMAHRLAWLHMTGAWPKHEVDHINGVICDNRWVNLRDVRHDVNSQNRRSAHRNNKSGLIGVSPYKDRFQANISASGRRQFLGIFATREEAFRAYVVAKRSLHPGCTI